VEIWIFFYLSISLHLHWLMQSNLNAYNLFWHWQYFYAVHCYGWDVNHWKFESLGGSRFTVNYDLNCCLFATHNYTKTWPYGPFFFDTFTCTFCLFLKREWVFKSIPLKKNAKNEWLMKQFSFWGELSPPQTSSSSSPQTINVDWHIVIPFIIWNITSIKCCQYLEWVTNLHYPDE